MAARIEDYALLGDGRSAALVARDGSVDWLCWPTFSGDPVFAALLGDARNGCWRIAPANDAAAITRQYLPDTMVLETRFATPECEIVLLDWMAWNVKQPRLLRRVRCARGRARLEFTLKVCCGYGRSPAPAHRSDGPASHAWVTGDHVIRLEGAGDMQRDEAGVRGKMTLAAGMQRDFALCCHPMGTGASMGAGRDGAAADAKHAEENPGKPVDVSAALRDTVASWRLWSAIGRIDGPYAGVIQRSLMTLKALSSIPSGGLVAAPTSSLPECLGGGRNWDYRFCWLRDASFTMLALIRGRYFDEAIAWRDWLVGAISRHPSQLRVLYDVSGDPGMQEWECTWLPGYEHSRPVRFGNGAVGQLQLDIRGEVMNALYVSRKHGLPPDENAWNLETRVIDHLGTAWHEPDNGFWEIRGERRQFTTSKVLMWLAVDRAMRSAREYGHPAPLDDWRSLADRIRRDIVENGFDPDRNVFTSSYGSTELDASLLLIPLTGFLPIADPRVRDTVQAIEASLMEDGLLRRYRPGGFHDGQENDEGAFIACSFWLVQVRYMQGRHDEARELFERAAALRNDLGLLSEEYDLKNRRMCGNFPQALSHVALVNAAMMLRGEHQSWEP